MALIVSVSEAGVLASIFYMVKEPVAEATLTEYLRAGGCSVSFIEVSKDYGKAKFKIAYEFGMVKRSNSRALMPTRLMSLVKVIDDLINMDCISKSSLGREHARGVRKTRSAVRGESGGVVSVQDTDEEDEEDEVESGLEGTKKEVEHSIALVPVMETLGIILNKMEAQEKNMQVMNKTLGDLSTKVGKLQEMGERQEADLTAIKADLKARPGHWCSFCKLSTHALEECRNRKRKATLGAAQCAECGGDNHASTLHFVTDQEIRDNIKIKFGAHFVFK